MFNFFSLATLALLLTLTGTASAMQCEVKFRANKVNTEKRWFGEFAKVETRSGTTTGEGSSKSKCESHALKKITKEGWEITYQKVISSK